MITATATIAALVATVLVENPCDCGFCRTGARVPSLKAATRKLDALRAAFAAGEEAAAVFYLSQGGFSKVEEAVIAGIEAKRERAYEAMATAQIRLSWAECHHTRAARAEAHVLENLRPRRGW